MLPREPIISITTLSSRPTNYIFVLTTSQPTLEQVIPPYGQFIPFIVPAPDTPATSPTKVIYPAPPTTFPTNLISFEDVDLRSHIRSN